MLSSIKSVYSHATSRPEFVSCSSCEKQIPIDLHAYDWKCAAGHLNVPDESKCRVCERKPAEWPTPSVRCDDCDVVTNVPWTNASKAVWETGRAAKKHVDVLTSRPTRAFHCHNCNTKLRVPSGPWTCHSCAENNEELTKACTKCRQSYDDQRVICGVCATSTQVKSMKFVDTFTTNFKRISASLTKAYYDVSGRPHTTCPRCWSQIDLSTLPADVQIHRGTWGSVSSGTSPSLSSAIGSSISSLASSVSSAWSSKKTCDNCSSSSCVSVSCSSASSKSASCSSCSSTPCASASCSSVSSMAVPLPPAAQAGPHPIGVEQEKASSASSSGTASSYAGAASSYAGAVGHSISSLVSSVSSSVSSALSSKPKSGGCESCSSASCSSASCSSISSSISSSKAQEWLPENKRAVGEEWKGLEGIPQRQWEDSDFHYLECPTCHLQLSYTLPAGSDFDSSAGAAAAGVAAAGAAEGARAEHRGEEHDEGYRGHGAAPISSFGVVHAASAPSYDSGSSSSLASGTSSNIGSSSAGAAPLSNFGSVRPADSASGQGWGTSASFAGSSGIGSSGIGSSGIGSSGIGSSSISSSGIGSSSISSSSISSSGIGSSGIGSSGIGSSGIGSSVSGIGSSGIGPSGVGSSGIGSSGIGSGWGTSSGLGSSSGPSFAGSSGWQTGSTLGDSSSSNIGRPGDVSRAAVDLSRAGDALSRAGDAISRASESAAGRAGGDFNRGAQSDARLQESRPAPAV